jgi:hypothetical protein
MMFSPDAHHRALAISVAAFCVLLCAQTKIRASSPAATDITSTSVARYPRVPGPRSPAPRSPAARTVDQEFKLASDYLAGRGVAQDLRQEIGIGSTISFLNSSKRKVQAGPDSPPSH